MAISLGIYPIFRQSHFPIISDLLDCWNIIHTVDPISILIILSHFFNPELWIAILSLRSCREVPSTASKPCCSRGALTNLLGEFNKCGDINKRGDTDYIYMYVCLSACLPGWLSVCLSVSVSLSVSLFVYVRMYVCVHACMYVCVCVCMCVSKYVCMCVCLYVCMYACMHAWMHGCMYVFMHICMFVNMYIYIHTYIYIYIHMVPLQDPPVSMFIVKGWTFTVPSRKYMFFYMYMFSWRVKKSWRTVREHYCMVPFYL